MNPYEELGVPRDATEDQIKAAHRKGVRQHHPDAGGTPEKFGALQRSYEILADPDKRAKYDRTGETEGPTIGEADAAVLEGVSQIISMVISDAMDLETTNVRQILLDTLDETTAALAEQKRDLTRRLKRVDKLETKFKRRKGRKVKEGAADESGLLFLALRGQRDAIAKEVRRVEENQAMHERVCGVFKAFDYSFTTPAPAPAWSAYQPMGFVNLGGFTGFVR